MNVDEVGKWRFCPACGRPLMELKFDSEDQDNESFNFEDIRCSCCERPWIACPCTPAEESEVRAYVERLEKVIDYIGVAESGGELFPVGPSDTEYAEDGNTVVRHVGPWRFLEGKGETFLDAVEDQMRMDDEAPNSN